MVTRLKLWNEISGYPNSHQTRAQETMSSSFSHQHHSQAQLWPHQTGICPGLISAATNGWLGRAAANCKVGGKDRCVISWNVLLGLVAQRLLSDTSHKAEKYLSCLAVETGILGKCHHEVIIRMWLEVDVLLLNLDRVRLFFCPYHLPA